MVSYPEGSSHSGDKVGDSGSVLGDANAGLPVVQGPGTAVHFLIWRWFFFQCDRVVSVPIKCFFSRHIFGPKTT